jgi:hypothetical protein
VGCGCVQRQIPECKGGDDDGGRSFNDEEVAPWSQSTAVELEDAEGEEAGECTGDRLSGVEDCESAGEFASTVEPGISLVIERNSRHRGKNLHGLVVDDKREESGFTHSQEPTNSHQPAKVLNHNNHQRAGSKASHHTRQYSAWSILLSQRRKERCSKHIRHVEDRQDGVVLETLEVEIRGQTSSFGISHVGFVQRVEEVHDGEQRQEMQVEFPYYCSLFLGVDGGDDAGLCDGDIVLVDTVQRPPLLGIDMLCRLHFWRPCEISSGDRMNVRVSCSRAAHPSYEVHAGKPRCDTVILLSKFSRCLVHVCLSKRINPNIVVIRD